MVCVILFGKTPIKVDIVGRWLAGRELGNFDLFHSAVWPLITAVSHIAVRSSPATYSSE